MNTVLVLMLIQVSHGRFIFIFNVIYNMFIPCLISFKSNPFLENGQYWVRLKDWFEQRKIVIVFCAGSAVPVEESDITFLDFRWVSFAQFVVFYVIFVNCCLSIVLYILSWHNQLIFDLSVLTLASFATDFLIHLSQEWECCLPDHLKRSW